MPGATESSKSERKLLELLRRVEWAAGSEGGECPICYGLKPVKGWDLPRWSPEYRAQFNHQKGCDLLEALEADD
jgi:hypothetical protein